MRSRPGSGLRSQARWTTLLFTALMLVVGCTAGSEGRDSSGAELPPGPQGQEGEWRLVFHDEFAGPRLDRRNWVTCHWWDDDGCTIATNNELQWYQPDNVFLRDGKLVLQAREHTVTAPDGRRFDYTSGMISSGSLEYRGPLLHEFEHVYVEMRAKVPAGKGLWPAFWLLPSSRESRPEIDVMEILGHQPDTLHMHYHYSTRNGRLRSVGSEWQAEAPLTDWHVYAVDWQPFALTWYLDGEKVYYFHDDDERGFISDEPMYLLANLAVGGDWPGAPDEHTVFPAELEIDYIRVWMRD